MNCVFLDNDDAPPITGVRWDDGREGFCVGIDGVTRIVVDRVAGQCGYVPWFSVYSGDVLTGRCNAAQIGSVAYAKGTQ